MVFVYLRYVTLSFQSWEKKKEGLFQLQVKKTLRPFLVQCVEQNRREEHGLVEESLDKRALRRKLTSSEKFNRRGFAEEKEATQLLMNSEFSSTLLQEAKAGNNEIRSGQVTVKLADSYGFLLGSQKEQLLWLFRNKKTLS
ncbi:4-hydroxy-3-methylbut-2-enyl diphosphate reductase [Galdieria sulphuraria]|nr:4-hydroxy-3-methylbut-2-enyl diphosphate reductase [Galdieria sulphuraria]